LLKQMKDWLIRKQAARARRGRLDALRAQSRREAESFIDYRRVNTDAMPLFSEAVMRGGMANQMEVGDE
jgi:hypothetical protein